MSEVGYAYLLCGAQYQNKPMSWECMYMFSTMLMESWYIDWKAMHYRGRDGNVYR